MPDVANPPSSGRGVEGGTVWRSPETTFALDRKEDWEALDRIVQAAKRRGVRRISPHDVPRLPRLYADACADLAWAEEAHYSAALSAFLHALVARAHDVLYAREPFALGPLWWRFPVAVRRFRRPIALAAALFGLSFLAGVLASLHDPTFAFRIVPESMLKPLTESYARGFADGRGAGEGTLMAGFYVENNIGIALRCFSLGAFLGIGSAFYLAHNGLATGAIVGYVASQGPYVNVLTFMAGHAALELTAIVLAGGAGLALGWSVVAPGAKTRLASLQDAGRGVVPVVFGSAVMLAMAAGVEAFWSGSSLPATVKRAVGVLVFLLTLSYFLFVGRRAALRDPPLSGGR